MNVWIEAENGDRQIGCVECGELFLTAEELKDRQEDEGERD
jgi:hypothetical protein